MAFRNTIACRALGGKFGKRLAIVTRTPMTSEGCALRNTIACRALGGKFRK